MEHRHYTSGNTGDMSGESYIYQPGFGCSKSACAGARSNYIDKGGSECYNYKSDGRHDFERWCFDLSHTHWWGNYSGNSLCNSGDTSTYRKNVSTVGDNNETRPTNYTIRIWKRIS